MSLIRSWFWLKLFLAYQEVEINARMHIWLPPNKFAPEGKIAFCTPDQVGRSPPDFLCMYTEMTREAVL